MDECEERGFNEKWILVKDGWSVARIIRLPPLYNRDTGPRVRLASGSAGCCTIVWATGACSGPRGRAEPHIGARSSSAAAPGALVVDRP